MGKTEGEFGMIDKISVRCQRRNFMKVKSNIEGQAEQEKGHVKSQSLERRRLSRVHFG